MQYIAICGTVGSGKTTLLRRLLAAFWPRALRSMRSGRRTIPYIHEYYSDSKRWSFHSQVTFLSLYFDDPKWKNEPKPSFSSSIARFSKIWSSPNTGAVRAI